MNALRLVVRVIDALITACGVVVGLVPDPTLANPPVQPLQIRRRA